MMSEISENSIRPSASGESTTTQRYAVRIEPTPNPQSMKFVFNETIADEPVAFTNSNEAKQSPLAEKLFGFPWMAGVFIGQNFITISKQEWVEWEVLMEPLRSLLEEHFNEGQPLFAVAEPAQSHAEHNGDPIVKQIVEILEREIRPAVAMDGGDVLFQKYQDHVVYLRLKGSCSGCPSATYTLKMGIETRLKDSIPEIKEVVSI